MRRAADEAAAQGFDALVVAPSPDLAYLTGYDPMPLERPTLLVLRPERSPAMLVPELERPLAAGCPGRRRRSSSSGGPTGWTPTRCRGTAPAVRGPRRGRGPALGEPPDRAPGARPGDVAFAPASPVIGRLRAVKDEDELAALRSAAGRAPTRRSGQICGMALPRSARGGDRGRPRGPPRAQRPRPRRLHDRRERPELRLSAPRARRTHDRCRATPSCWTSAASSAGTTRDTTRTVVVGEPPEGFERGLRRGAGGAGGRRATRSRPGVEAQAGRPRRPRRSSTTRATASASSTGPATASGSRCTSRPYIVEGNDWVARARA